MVNDYQNTLARLQMDFATEMVSSGQSTTSVDQIGLFTDQTVAKTGDNTKIMRYVCMQGTKE